MVYWTFTQARCNRFENSKLNSRAIYIVTMEISKVSTLFGLCAAKLGLDRIRKISDDDIRERAIHTLIFGMHFTVCRILPSDDSKIYIHRRNDQIIACGIWNPTVYIEDILALNVDRVCFLSCYSAINEESFLYVQPIPGLNGVWRIYSSYRYPCWSYYEVAIETRLYIWDSINNAIHESRVTVIDNERDSRVIPTFGDACVDDITFVNVLDSIDFSPLVDIQPSTHKKIKSGNALDLYFREFPRYVSADELTESILYTE